MADEQMAVTVPQFNRIRKEGRMSVAAMREQMAALSQHQTLPAVMQHRYAQTHSKTVSLMSNGLRLSTGTTSVVPLDGTLA
jgi:hypothetical protein